MRGSRSGEQGDNRTDRRQSINVLILRTGAVDRRAEAEDIRTTANCCDRLKDNKLLQHGRQHFAGHGVDLVDGGDVNHITDVQGVACGEVDGQGVGTRNRSNRNRERTCNRTRRVAVQRHGFIPVEAIQLTNRPLLVLTRDVAGGVEQRLQRRDKGSVHSWGNENTLFTTRGTRQLNQPLTSLHERRGRVRINSQLTDDVVHVLIGKKRGVGVNLLGNLSNRWLNILLADFFLRTLHFQSLFNRIPLKVNALNQVAIDSDRETIDWLRRVAKAVTNQETLRQLHLHRSANRELLIKFLVVFGVEKLRHFQLVNKQAEGFHADPVCKNKLVGHRQARTRRCEVSKDQSNQHGQREAD